METLIQDDALVLLQGDSITSTSRNREEPESMGYGYADMVAAWFSMLYPAKNVKFVNRGVPGDRVKDLQARWKVDCMDLKPDWVSILVGVNDTWRRYDSNDPTSAEQYEEGYRDLLTQVRDGLGANLIIMEPFVLPTRAELDQFREDLDPKIHVARKLAREFDAIYIPLDGLFAGACAEAEPAFWGEDGVHPSRAGHAFIAQHWLAAVGAM